MSHKSNYDIHHKIPQKWKKDFEHPDEINDSRNKKSVKKNRHMHKHGKDGADTPVMTMMEEVKFNLSVLQKDFAQDILEVFQKHYGKYYIFETHIQEELGRLFELEDAFRHYKSHETPKRKE